MFKNIYLNSLFLFFVIIFSPASISADAIADSNKSSQTSETKTNNTHQNQQDLKFYIINLFGNPVALEYKDQKSNKTISVTIKSNNYSELKSCTKATILYNDKSITYNFDLRFKSKYYIIKKNRAK